MYIYIYIYTYYTIHIYFRYRTYHLSKCVIVARVPPLLDSCSIILAAACSEFASYRPYPFPSRCARCMLATSTRVHLFWYLCHQQLLFPIAAVTVTRLNPTCTYCAEQHLVAIIRRVRSPGHARGRGRTYNTMSNRHVFVLQIFAHLYLCQHVVAHGFAKDRVFWYLHAIAFNCAKHICTIFARRNTQE